MAHIAGSAELDPRHARRVRESAALEARAERLAAELLERDFRGTPEQARTLVRRKWPRLSAGETTMVVQALEILQLAYRLWDRLQGKLPAIELPNLTDQEN